MKRFGIVSTAAVVVIDVDSMLVVKRKHHCRICVKGQVPGLSFS